MKLAILSLLATGASASFSLRHLQDASGLDTGFNLSDAHGRYSGKVGPRAK